MDGGDGLDRHRWKMPEAAPKTSPREQAAFHHQGRVELAALTIQHPHVHPKRLLGGGETPIVAAFDGQERRDVESLAEAEMPARPWGSPEAKWKDVGVPFPKACS